jgi:hypothetical protein
VFGPYRSCLTIRSRATPAQALQAPSAAHWFGTDQLGRDIFSRVIAATRLDFFIAVASVALVFHARRARRHRAGYFGGWVDKHGRPHRRYDHGVPAVRAGDGHRRGARQQRHQHRHRHRDHQLSALCPRRAGRGECPPRGRLRAGGAAVGQFRLALLLVQILPNIMPIMACRCR